MTVHQNNKAKTLADSYELLLELVEDLILIQENLNIDGNPILEVEYQSTLVEIVQFEQKSDI